ncbi:aldehyde ferredoxin oxidoreductase [Pyrobaculum sp. 3827-6]|uniref:aldehyde ferredoxin oxidoreductase N-terminal domain-containing protein n=1 Tax=Pyrobaculum sp. 3827-6 TaxID=2983604 RepID=UPI0021D84C1F|nr:aldehyde ferredoxin oxidoreductase N-terminal domain-containing protein [Pyrobaculum sp. 3827-6]MCU7788661.1 aldehyde ferredoxin oxidoreductase [Pyrobaculum sp. 3827-6]
MIVLEINVESGDVRRRELESTGPLDLALAIHKERETWRLDPLAPEAPVVFGMGPFVGGRLHGVHRLVFVFKSPQTKTLHVSALGGAAYKALGMGAHAVAIVGKAPRPTALLIAGGEVKFVEAEPGDAYEVARRLYAAHREFFVENDARVLAVGPAAFTTYNGAVVSIDIDAKRGEFRLGAEDFAARGGPGTALAQGHNVVAIAVGGLKKPLYQKVADAEAINQIFKTKMGKPYIDVLNEKTVKYRYDPKMGTGGTFGVNYPHYRDLLPLFGYKSIYMTKEERVKHADLVMELFWKPFQVEVFEKARSWYNCGEPCPVVCKKVWRGKKVDYESFHAVGPFIGNYIFQEAVPLVDKIDRLGLDAIETGHLVAWLFDAVHAGLLKPEEVGLSDVPAFDPAAFKPVEDSRKNARLAGELIEGFVNNSTEVLALVARHGIRKAARELERRYPDRVRAAGYRFRDLAVYAAYGTEGYMTPNFYWAPGLIGPMYIQGRYWTNYNPTFMPPEDFAKSSYERAVAEAYIDNAGICRFHRGWAEPVLKELYALAGLKPPTPQLYRDIAYYAKLAGAEPMPWESKRARDLVATLARELGAKEWEFEDYDDYYEWWVRYKEALDKLIFS